jgi:hypothetical protein
VRALVPDAGASAIGRIPASSRASADATPLLFKKHLLQPAASRGQTASVLIEPEVSPGHNMLVVFDAGLAEHPHEFHAKFRREQPFKRFPVRDQAYGHIKTPLNLRQEYALKLDRPIKFCAMVCCSERNQISRRTWLLAPHRNDHSSDIRQKIIPKQDGHPTIQIPVGALLKIVRRSRAGAKANRVDFSRLHMDDAFVLLQRTFHQKVGRPYNR